MMTLILTGNEGKEETKLLKNDKVTFTIEEATNKISRMASLLLECRDALPAISKASAKLHGVRLDLDKRIEETLRPWKLEEE